MKLGGSVLTDKSAYRTLRPDVLARLAAEMAASRQRVVLVHGAGSYGHVLAKQHGLAAGDDGSAQRRVAFGRVLADVRELQSLVVRALCDAGLAAAPFHAFDLARTRGGDLVNFAYGPLLDALSGGFTPVISGDGVLDAGRGFGILSGDVLMVELARAMHPQRAVFVTDVDGIFDKDPHEPGARLHARIDLREELRVGASRHHDVTGGMAGKLARARDLARTGVPVQVVNGLAPGRLLDALEGRETVGTLVTA